MATISASPNPGIVGRPIALIGEGFANATEVVVEIAEFGLSSEIVSDAAGNIASDALADHAVVTLTATGNCGNGDTVTLGSRVYTMRTGTATLLPNEIRVGAAATDSLDNIKAAVNGGSNEGVTFGLGTLPHADILAGNKNATTIKFFARVAGTAGNSLASTETLNNMSFGAATLTGGAAAAAKAMAFTPVRPGTYGVSATDGTNSASCRVRVFS